MKAIDRIAQAAFLAGLLEQPGRHAAAKHVAEHLQRVKLRIVLREPRERQCDMHLLELALFDMGAPAEPRRRWRRPGRPAETRKALFNLRDYGVMADRAGGGKHHVGPAVMAAEIIAQLRAVERAYRHRRAENGAAERLVGKGRGLQ